MPLEPLVQQIGNQLKRQSLADLITLKQLISKMSGIEIAQDMTKAQVACLAGGALMQREAIDLTQIRHPAPPTDDNERMTRGRPKKSPIFENSKQRLLQALQSSGLTLPILVAIVQAREACVFVATENLGHTKQLGLAFDDVRSESPMFEALQADRESLAFDSVTMLSHSTSVSSCRASQRMISLRSFRRSEDYIRTLQSVGTSASI